MKDHTIKADKLNTRMCSWIEGEEAHAHNNVVCIDGITCALKMII